MQVIYGRLKRYYYGVFGISRNWCLLPTDGGCHMPCDCKPFPCPPYLCKCLCERCLLSLQPYWTKTFRTMPNARCSSTNPAGSTPGLAGRPIARGGTPSLTSTDAISRCLYIYLDASSWMSLSGIRKNKGRFFLSPCISFFKQVRVHLSDDP